MRRGTPTLIAVSSFGEGSRRVSPLTAPAGASVNEKERTDDRCALLWISLHTRTHTGSVVGKTTMKVDPLPNFDSTHMRPLWLSTMDLTIDSPKPVPGSASGILLPR